MFEEIEAALSGEQSITLDITRTKAGLRVIAAFKGGEGAARTPLMLSGTGLELDAAFAEQISGFSEAHAGLVSTLEAAKSVMDDAKKDAAKTAAASTKKAAPKAPVVTGTDKPAAPAPVAKPDPILDELF